MAGKQGVGPPFEINAGRLVLHLLWLSSSVRHHARHECLNCTVEKCTVEFAASLVFGVEEGGASTINVIKIHDLNAF